MIPAKYLPEFQWIMVPTNRAGLTVKKNIRLNTGEIYIKSLISSVKSELGYSKTYYLPTSGLSEFNDKSCLVFPSHRAGFFVYV